MSVDPLRRYRLIGVIATGLIATAVPLWLARRAVDPPARSPSSAKPPTFVGRHACRPCHQQPYEKWLGSDHDMSMALADEAHVLGDFENAALHTNGITTTFFRQGGRYMVRTPGKTGVVETFPIAYTLGFEPLQQYLVAVPGGRLQCLPFAWDEQRGQWFDLHEADPRPPGDWLHWTGAGQNWNSMCAQCHSTGLRKNFDPETNSYQTSWSEIDVSCEACHGPASLHVTWAKMPAMARPRLDNAGLVVNTKELTARQEVALCAPCHSRRSELGDLDHSGTDSVDRQMPSLLSEGLYHADGQILDEVYVWGSFTQSRMYAREVRCSDCHDSHRLTLRQPGNSLCLRCHRADTYDTKEHHFHQQTYRGAPSAGAVCISCHMPQQKYMRIDERADHSIRIPRPDLTAQLGTPNACGQAGCHQDKPLDWITDAYLKWYGQVTKPHYGAILAAGRAEQSEALPQLSRLAGDVLYPAVVRATALELLSRYSSAESVGALERGLVDANPLIRHTAAVAFTSDDLTNFVERLTPLLHDPSTAVRAQAALRLADVPVSRLKPYQLTARTEALDAYVKGMTHSLDFAFANHNLGQLFERLDRPKRAEQFYRQAIAIDDLDFRPKINLAILLNRTARNAEAEKLLKAVVNHYPEQYDAHYALGLLLGEMRRYREAEHHLSRAAAGMPNHAGAARNLSAIRRFLRQRQQ